MENSIQFLDPSFLDFNLDPDHFIQWAKLELQEEGPELFTGEYDQDVDGLCGYFCIYLGMLLRNKDLKGQMFAIDGHFGRMAHKWILYVLDGKSYYIDLTLQQFDLWAPKVAVCEFVHDIHCGYNYSQLRQRIPISRFIANKIDNFVDPITMEIPEKKKQHLINVNKWKNEQKSEHPSAL